MFSKIFLFLIFLIVLQCKFSQSGLLKVVENKDEFPPIPLSELVEELRREPEDYRRTHLEFITAVASYGDRLYNVYPDMSVECSKTIKAAFLVEVTLATTVEADEVIEDTIKAVAHDLKNATDLKEHPSELFCSRIEKAFAANSNLSASFEKAKKKAANLENASRRPPYSRVPLKSPESLSQLLIDKLDIPELAKLFSGLLFTVFSEYLDYSPFRMDIFVKTCVAMAKKERFADSIQRIFEKTINDTIPEIGVPDRVEKFKSTSEDPFLLLQLKMMREFYGYISGDPILKKEFDSLAAVMFPKAQKEDLDFSKF
ncbi:hypothetical protein V9T40_001584 [Parthenolecanium corni]|uniref:Uncharacterized protein n=1 Tax=Parthenolecanium corni TaxID=536013 RepID=A0AAN9TMK3_9HEMI